MSDVAISSAKQAVTKGNLTEDWLALVIGVLVFALSLFSLGGIDLLGWAVTTSVWKGSAVWRSGPSRPATGWRPHWWGRGSRSACWRAPPG